MGAISWTNFGDQLWGLWRAALGELRDFGEQISGTALGSSFLEQLWGATMRGAAFDDAFWEQFSGSHFGKPLWELAFVGSIW